jgi:hypothetical protein
MQKKISTTYWFTVAIAIVALLAYTGVAYTEVGAEDACETSFEAGGFRVEHCGFSDTTGTYRYRISATKDCADSKILNFHQFLPVCKDATPKSYFHSVGPSTKVSGLSAIGEGYTDYGGWKVGDFTGQVLSLDSGPFNCNSEPLQFTVTVKSAIKNVCAIEMALVVNGVVMEGFTQGLCCSHPGVPPVAFFNSFGDSETTVELFKNQTVKSVVDTQTRKPYRKIKLLICEDLDEDGKKGPEEPCYPATFGTLDGCLIDGNPRYYGYGGDGYKRE